MAYNKNILVKHFKKEWKGMIKHFDSFCIDTEPEELHYLRVCVKKINFLLFSGGKQNKSLKSNFIPVKYLFKESGSIRSLYIILELLKKHSVLSKKTNTLLNDEITHKIRILLLHQPRYSRQLSQLKKKIELELKPMKLKALIALMRLEIKKLAKLYESSDSKPEDIHNSRKTIKRLLFFNQLFGKKFKAKIDLNTHYLDQAQVEIGNWHDLHDTIIYLKEKRKGNIKALKKLTLLNKSAISKVKKITLGFAKKALSVV